MSVTTDTYDVVVIGAGLVGALVAYHLAEESLNVAVLEASSQSGNMAKWSGGLALLGTPEPYVLLQKREGEERARQIWDTTHENLSLLRAVLQKTNQDAQRVGCLRFSDNRDEAEQIQESVNLLQQHDYTSELEDATDYGYLVAQNTLEDILFDPQVLIEVLLQHPNITVEYNAEVKLIKPREEEGASGTPLLAVWAHKTYVRSKGVVLAGGAHSLRLSRSLGSVISPVQIHCVDFRNANPLPVPLILNQGQVMLRALDAEHWRMLGWSSAEEDVLSLLTPYANQLCPDATVLRRYSGWVAQSRDQIPLVGMPPDLPNVYSVNGLGPWGLSWAFVAAKRLSDLMIHDESPGLLELNRLFE